MTSILYLLLSHELSHDLYIYLSCCHMTCHMTFLPSHELSHDLQGGSPGLPGPAPECQGPVAAPNPGVLPTEGGPHGGLPLPAGRSLKGGALGQTHGQAGEALSHATHRLPAAV